MSDGITIALDAMGGDGAPAIVLKGAEIALQRHPGVRYLLFGVEEEIRPLLTRLPALRQAATLFHTSEIVAADAKPSLALRTGRQSSMRLAIDAVAEGRADGVVSAEEIVLFDHRSSLCRRWASSALCLFRICWTNRRARCSG